MGLKGDLGELPLPDLVEMTSRGRQDRPPRRSSTRRRPSPACSCSAAAASSAPTAASSRPRRRSTRSSASRPARSTSTPRRELDEGDVNLLDRVAAHRGHAPPRRDVPPAPAPAGAGRRALRRRRARRTPSRRACSATSGPGARTVGDVVEGILVGGDADEYDALTRCARLAAGGTVRVERPAEAGEADAAGRRGPPQPELER